MTALTNRPANENFLSQLGFRFVLKRAPHINYFVQRVNIPSISLGTAPVSTPFVEIPLPGTKLTFQPLRVDFKVDENMENYLEIYNWMFSLGFPDNFSQYSPLRGAQAAQLGEGVFSDITLTILNSSMNPNKVITFVDAYPVDLGDVSLDSTDTDVTYASSSVTFAYRKFDVQSVT